MAGNRWGFCPMVDADGQGCIAGVGHKGPHHDSGLRAWLESSAGDSILRTYPDHGADQWLQMEAPLFAKFGFYPVSQSGSTATTGPGMGSIFALGILAFGSKRTSSTVSVMFRREQPAPAAAAPTPASSIPDRIRALGELRDSGHITAEEFDAKRRELMEQL